MFSHFIYLIAIIKRKLKYDRNAGTKWSYNNVFQKQMDVIATASNQSFEEYFNAKLKNKLGMDGFWKNGILFKIYHTIIKFTFTIIIFFIATPQCTESLMSIHHMLQALRYFDWKQPLSVARYDKSYIFLLNYFTLF